MTWRQRSRALLARAGSLARHAGRRTAKEARIRKLQLSIDRHNATLGKALYLMLEGGTLQVDLLEAREEVEHIRALRQRLQLLRAGDDVGSEDAPQDHLTGET